MLSGLCSASFRSFDERGGFSGKLVDIPIFSPSIVLCFLSRQLVGVSFSTLMYYKECMTISRSKFALATKFAS